MATTYNKLITDDDIDGLVGAAILLRVYPDLEVLFSNPMTIQDHEMKYTVDAQTIVTDLPFLEGCGLYYDHHKSNKPSHEYNGLWRLNDSAAHILFDEYKDKVDLLDFEFFLLILDKYDSGNLTYDDVNQMSFFLRLIYSTKRFNEKYYRYLIDILVNKGPAGLEGDEKINSEISKLEEKIKLMCEDIQNVVVTFPPIIFINMMGKPYRNVHISIIEKEFIDFFVFVLFKTDNNKVRCMLYSNNLNPKARQKNGEGFNLLAIAKSMNPESSGGHRSACGFTLPEGTTIEQCVKKLKPLLLEAIKE